MNIGDKVWSKGDEYTITSEPFMLHGGMFQKAIGESGREIVVPSAAQQAANTERSQREWKDQQAQFARLRV